MISIAANSRLDLTTAARTRSSRPALWIGRGLSALGVLFMVVDAGVKVLDLIPPDVKAANSLGWSEHSLPAIGVIALLCVALYLIPRTAVLGAILLTGYFGGAIASHMRIDNPLLSHTLFPVYIAALFWGGLFLRDARVRALLSPRKSA